jgi:hypothetical protein
MEAKQIPHGWEGGLDIRRLSCEAFRSTDIARAATLLGSAGAAACCTRAAAGCASATYIAIVG